MVCESVIISATASAPDRMEEARIMRQEESPNFSASTDVWMQSRLSNRIRTPRPGRVKYFDKGDIKQDRYDILKASSAIPFVCQPYDVEGIPYFDGALGDPVPVQKAFDCGCEKTVVILTKPERELRTSNQDEKFARRIQKKYPEAAKAHRERARRYNEGVMIASEYAKKGCALIVSPDDTCGVDTLTRDKEAMDRLYKKGYQDAEKIHHFIES